MTTTFINRLRSKGITAAEILYILYQLTINNMSCSDCFKGVVRFGKPNGIEKTLHGVRTYVAGNPDLQSSAIIFITDAFGFNLINSKLLADVYASKTQFTVLVPDIIPGGGVPIKSLALMESMSTPVSWWNVVGHLRRFFTLVRMMTIFIPFALRTKNVFPSILSYARSVKADLPAGRKLGAAGFCWGGLQTTKLAQESAIDCRNTQLLNAHFVAHPAGLKVPKDIVNGIRQFNVPFSMAIGDQDMILSKEKVEEIEADLRTEFTEDSQHNYEIKMYADCGHGFAVRADAKKKLEDDASEQAMEQAVSWFKTYLS
jgi:dienelactone hydrolase